MSEALVSDDENRPAIPKKLEANPTGNGWMMTTMIIELIGRKDNNRDYDHCTWPI